MRYPGWILVALASAVVIYALYASRIKPNNTALSATQSSVEIPEPQPPAKPTQPLPPAPPPIDPAATFASMLKNLSSTDATSRTTALLTLSHLPPEQRPALKQAADAATDPALKTALTHRLEEIDDQLAIDPLPISLDINGATYSELATALTAATGTPVGAWHDALDKGSFSLHADNMPFWDVIGKLAQQYPFCPVDPSGFRLYPGEPAMHVYARSGGFVMIALETGPGLAPRAGAARPPLVMKLRLAADPRISVFHHDVPVFTKIVDELGNNLLPPTVPPTRPAMALTQSQVWAYELPLLSPPNIGTKITSAVATMKILVSLKEEKLVVENPDQRIGEQLNIGGRTFSFTHFEVTPTAATNFTLEEENPGPTPQEVRATLVDKDGYTRWSMLVRGNMSVSGSFMRPVKMIITVPQKTREIVVPFELKDVPLP